MIKKTKPLPPGDYLMMATIMTGGSLQTFGI